MSETHVVKRDDEQRPLEPLFHTIRTLDMGAPLRWLRLGWQDMKRAPVPAWCTAFRW